MPKSLRAVVALLVAAPVAEGIFIVVSSYIFISNNPNNRITLPVFLAALGCAFFSGATVFRVVWRYLGKVQWC